MIAKAMIALALLAVPLTACSEHVRQQEQETAKMKELVIPVEGMACSSCANRVKQALASIDGVGETRVSVDEKNVVTHYDPRRLSPDRMIAAINGLGFKAGPLPEVPR